MTLCERVIYSNNGDFVGCADGSSTKYLSFPKSVPNKLQLRLVDQFIDEIVQDNKIDKSLEKAAEVIHKYTDYGDKDTMLSNITVVRPSDLEKLKRQKILNSEFVLEALELFLGEDFEAFQRLFRFYMENPNSLEGGLIKAWVSETFGCEVLIHFDDDLLGKFGAKVGISRLDWADLSINREKVFKSLERAVHETTRLFNNTNLNEVLLKVYAFTQVWLSRKFEDTDAIDLYVPTFDSSQKLKQRNINCVQTALLTPFNLSEDDQEIFLGKTTGYKQLILATEEMLVTPQTKFTGIRFGLDSVIYMFTENFVITEFEDIAVQKIDFVQDVDSILNFVGFEFLHEVLRPAIEQPEFDPSYEVISELIRPEFTSLLLSNLTAEKISNKLKKYAKLLNTREFLAQEEVNPDTVEEFTQRLLFVEINIDNSISILNDMGITEQEELSVFLDAIALSSKVFPNQQAGEDFKKEEILSNDKLVALILDNPFSNKLTNSTGLIDPKQYATPIDTEVYKRFRSDLYEMFNKEILDDPQIVALYTFQKLLDNPDNVEISQNEMDNLIAQVTISPELSVVATGESFLVNHYVNFDHLKEFLEVIKPKQFENFSLIIYRNVDLDSGNLQQLVTKLDGIIKDLNVLSKHEEYASLYTETLTTTTSLLFPRFLEIEKIRVPMSDVKELVDKGIKLHKKYKLDSVSASQRLEYYRVVRDAIFGILQLYSSKHNLTLKLWDAMQELSVDQRGGILLPLPFNYEISEFLDNKYFRGLEIPNIKETGLLELMKPIDIDDDVTLQLRGVGLIEYAVNYLLTATTTNKEIVKDFRSSYISLQATYGHSTSKSLIQVMVKYEEFLREILDKTIRRSRGIADFRNVPYDVDAVLKTLHLMSLSLAQSTTYTKFNRNTYTITSGENAEVSYTKLTKVVSEHLSALVPFKINFNFSSVFGFFVKNLSDMFINSTEDTWADKPIITTAKLLYLANQGIYYEEP